MTVSRSLHHATLLAVATALLLVIAACGDAAPSDVPQPGDVATATSADSLEGHATEAAGQPGEPDASDIDLAPDLNAAEAWYNTEPISLEERRGQPVLLVFWATY